MLHFLWTLFWAGSNEFTIQDMENLIASVRGESLLPSQVSEDLDSEGLPDGAELVAGDAGVVALVGAGQPGDAQLVAPGPVGWLVGRPGRRLHRHAVLEPADRGRRVPVRLAPQLDLQGEREWDE